MKSTFFSSISGCTTKVPLLVHIKNQTTESNPIINATLNSWHKVKEDNAQDQFY